MTPSPHDAGTHVGATGVGGGVAVGGAVITGLTGVHDTIAAARRGAIGAAGIGHGVTVSRAVIAFLAGVDGAVTAGWQHAQQPACVGSRSPVSALPSSHSSPQSATPSPQEGRRARACDTHPRRCRCWRLPSSQAPRRCRSTPSPQAGPRQRGPDRRPASVSLLAGPSSHSSQQDVVGHAVAAERGDLDGDHRRAVLIDLNRARPAEAMTVMDAAHIGQTVHVDGRGCRCGPAFQVHGEGRREGRCSSAGISGKRSTSLIRIQAQGHVQLDDASYRRSPSTRRHLAGDDGASLPQPDGEAVTVITRATATAETASREPSSVHRHFPPDVIRTPADRTVGDDWARQA